MICLNRKILKILALIFMILDHIGYLFPFAEFIFLRVIGRLAAPIFFYCLIDGFYNSKNKLQYSLRLGLWGVQMGITNVMLQHSFKHPYSEFSFLRPNIFLSLLCSILIIWALDELKKDKSKYYLLGGIVSLSALSLLTEAGLLGLSMTYIFYYSRNNIKKLNCSFSILSFISIFLYSPVQGFMILALLPINLYNGDLGKYSKKLNEFFYYIYPLHLWILYIISANYFNNIIS